MRKISSAALIRCCVSILKIFVNGPSLTSVSWSKSQRVTHPEPTFSYASFCCPGFNCRLLRLLPHDQRAKVILSSSSSGDAELGNISNERDRVS